MRSPRVSSNTRAVCSHGDMTDELTHYQSSFVLPAQSHETQTTQWLIGLGEKSQANLTQADTDIRTLKSRDNAVDFEATQNLVMKRKELTIGSIGDLERIMSRDRGPSGTPLLPSQRDCLIRVKQTFAKAKRRYDEALCLRSHGASDRNPDWYLGP